MRTRFAIPLIAFGILALALAVGLNLKPAEIPSVLIGKPAPEFDLPLLGAEASSFSSEDLKTGQPVLVNVYASWCLPCRVEHPQLMALAEAYGATIHAINYKDRDDKAQRFLDRLGNPFTKVGVDREGRTSIEWGVYGVPETFIVDGAGNIVHKHIGPVMERDLERSILPILEELGG
ncbi:MAG: DsbE family thiol:disulfide interchange protein [Sphingomonadales bacterium]|nr:DsbE family thiol:disulfide interchange protein [Sphingomonadales bacterium]